MITVRMKTLMTLKPRQAEDQNGDVAWTNTLHQIEIKHFHEIVGPSNEVDIDEIYFL